MRDTLNGMSPAELKDLQGLSGRIGREIFPLIEGRLALVNSLKKVLDSRGVDPTLNIKISPPDGSQITATYLPVRAGDSPLFIETAFECAVPALVRRFISTQLGVGLWFESNNGQDQISIGFNLSPAATSRITSPSIQLPIRPPESSASLFDRLLAEQPQTILHALQHDNFELIAHKLRHGDLPHEELEQITTAEDYTAMLNEHVLKVLEKKN